MKYVENYIKIIDTNRTKLSKFYKKSDIIL